MKVLIAPDSFKGSLSAIEVAGAIAEGILSVVPDADVIKIPMADGGEGTVSALVMATGGKMVGVPATDPLGKRVSSFYGILGDGVTAVIEMAAASGLPMLTPRQRNPLVTTTYGTGELIRAALDASCRKLVIGIGGSATNDGGIGMAQALGARILDADGKDVGFGGAFLETIASIDSSRLDPRLAECEIQVACDVSNPLCGPQGASAIYGPQKGATPEMIARLDRGLAHYAEVLKRCVGKDIALVPGSGAAGGLGGGLLAFTPAVLMRGIDIVVQASHMAERLRGADFVITGEGRTDAQTAFGKVPVGVAEVAKAQHIPVIVLSGALAKGFETIYDMGITAAFSIADRPMSLDEALSLTAPLLKQSAKAIARLYAHHG